MVHTCNLSAWEVETEDGEFQASQDYICEKLFQKQTTLKSNNVYI